MATTIPQDRVGRLSWYQARVASWNANAAAIGTTPADVGDVQARLAAAQAARAAQELALAEARAKTAAFYAAADALSTVGASVVKQIRAKGERTRDPAVYERAMVPAPAIPAPVGVPGTPTDLAVALNGNGALELTWKCANPARSAGTIYQVFRQVNGAGEFAYVGGVGAKKLTDAAVPRARRCSPTRSRPSARRRRACGRSSTSGSAPTPGCRP